MAAKRKTGRRPSRARKRGKPPARPAAPPARWLHLVRHGEYVQEGNFGPLGGPLTALGRRQAARVARYLKRLPVAIIHTSDLRRARQTADMISRELPRAPLRASPLLREACVVPLPKSRASRASCAESRRRFARIWRRWFRPAGRTRHEVVVCHGNLIRSLVVMALGVRPLSAWVRMGTYNCAVTTIAVYPGGRAAVMTVNDLGYLPRGMRT